METTTIIWLIAILFIEGLIGNSIRKNVIDRLELSLKYKKPNNADEILEFYNTSSGNWSLNSELKLAEKWNTILNEEIKK